MPARDPDPVQDLSAELCASLTHFFTDIDDTLTTKGLLPAEAFRSVWRLHEAGIAVVLVTGRPAGWCDHLARMWPVEGVIGENGAFYFRYDRRARRMHRRFLLSEEARGEGQRRLERVRERVLAEVPGTAVAADQPFRLADLAIDFCEDVPPLPRPQVRRIAAIAREEGAVAKISSIHVNCWYGDFDKVSCVRMFLEQEAGLSWTDVRDRVLFAGDSPNDEPMFREMTTSIGVANLSEFFEDMEHLPSHITTARSAEGFSEAVDVVISRR